MRKSVCNKRKLRGRARPRNGGISLFQRFLKMGASTVDCIWQRVESIPELLKHERGTIMKYRLLGKSGLRVSEASLGTMTFGDELGWGSPKAEAQRVYETYFEAGGNFIDTANFYTGGTSEQFLSEFIKGHRDSVVLATKYSNAAPGNFDVFLPMLLRFEGGYVDDPTDPGGETNKGVTMATFRQCSNQ